MKDVATAGKHIFCEKPLALELDKIDEALAVVKKAGVKLQVGFNRRFDKSFQQVREIVASGEIGRPCILRITNRDPDFPAMEFLRVSGGIFLDLAIHDFDMVRFQVGEVEEVYATGSVLIEPRVERIRRYRHGRGQPQVRQRRSRCHRQQPQGSLRLRPAPGSVLLERHCHGE